LEFIPRGVRTPSARSPEGTQKTVLVVDDNPFIREMICEAFVSAGFKLCVQAENGARALVEAEKTKPDAIILDLSMPVMKGLEAAPFLRRILPGAPIILYTIHESLALSQVDVAKLGISLVVSKSQPLTNLVATVNSLLESN
jgi:CheY-like chemotaxis protein